MGGQFQHFNFSIIEKLAGRWLKVSILFSQSWEASSDLEVPQAPTLLSKGFPISYKKKKVLFFFQV